MSGKQSNLISTKSRMSCGQLGLPNGIGMYPDIAQHRPQLIRDFLFPGIGANMALYGKSANVIGRDSHKNKCDVCGDVPSDRYHREVHDGVLTNIGAHAQNRHLISQSDVDWIDIPALANLAGKRVCPKCHKYVAYLMNNRSWMEEKYPEVKKKRAEAIIALTKIKLETT